MIRVHPLPWAARFSLTRRLRLTPGNSKTVLSNKRAISVPARRQGGGTGMLEAMLLVILE